ncbi:MAG: TatD family hydrolase [Chloroflexi bacterium]|nr:TatD family hydrolase [Chloroflexota bacterium]
MRLFDSHTHVQAPEFDADRDAVLERAREAGVAGQLVLGWDVPSSVAAIGLAEAQPGVLAAAGCHPHSAGEMDDASLARLAELARHPNVAAVGEIGLDFYRNFSPHDKQIDLFRHQLETAAEIAKPVAIHCRQAHETLLPIVEAWSRRLSGRLSDGRPLGVMHYFSGDLELARRYVELGLLISIHSSVTYPNNTLLQSVAQQISLDLLLVETDSPYGPPQSHRGQRNEPAYVGEAVAKIAELRGEPVERVAEATTENALRLFAPRTTAATTNASQALGA